MKQPFIIKNCLEYGGKTLERVCQGVIDDMGELGYVPIQIATTEANQSSQRIVILFKLSVANETTKENQQ